MPISTPRSYDNTGAPYNVSRVLNEQFEFDLGKYKAYSPLFLGTTFALAYGQSFASITSVLVHVYLYHGSEIWYQFRESLNQDEDIHMRLNRVYRQAPDWWYLVLGIVTFAMSVAACEAWETRMVFLLFHSFAYSYLYSLGGLLFCPSSLPSFSSSPSALSKPFPTFRSA